MSLKSFLVGGMLIGTSFATQAQHKIQTTTQADLNYLFLTKIEEGVLPKMSSVGISVHDVPYDCKPYDFILLPDSAVVSLYYCPTYSDQVVAEYPQSIDTKENPREKAKRHNNVRTRLYDMLLHSDTTAIHLKNN